VTRRTSRQRETCIGRRVDEEDDFDGGPTGAGTSMDCRAFENIGIDAGCNMAGVVVESADDGDDRFDREHDVPLLFPGWRRRNGTAATTAQ
jgi:hypothetical protein